MDSTGNSSLLVGGLEDPDTRRPVAGANVFVLWTHFEVKANKDLKRTPKTVQGVSDATGAYRVCGIPDEVEAVVYASNDNSTTSHVPLSSKSRGVLMRNLLLEGPGGAGDRKASIVGIVKTGKGVPVAGATVSVNGSDRAATTNAKGEYSLTRLPAGTRNVLVRRIGFAQVSVPIELTSDAPQRVNVVMSEVALTIDPMYVTARRDRALAQIGFAARRKRGLGDFRTRSDFERDNPRYLSDILGKNAGRSHRVRWRSANVARSRTRHELHPDVRRWIAVATDSLGRAGESPRYRRRIGRRRLSGGRCRD